MPSNGSGRRPDAATFRRRRLVAAVVVLVLVVAVLGAAIALVRAMSTSGGDAVAGTAAPTTAASVSATGSSGTTPTPAAGSTTTPTAGATPTPTTTPTPSATTTVACDPSKVTVKASTDKSVYAPGENPLLTLTVVNGNPVPCEVNVGTSQMEYLVTSGNDRVFSSKDCQVEPSDDKKRLAADASATANFPWDRVRTSAGCPSTKVQPRPGYYRLETKLGDRTSGQAIFQLQ